MCVCMDMCVSRLTVPDVCVSAAASAIMCVCLCVCVCWLLLQAMALRLPTVTEVVDRIDEADPVLAWQVGVEGD